jgi:hypothetical protein
MKITIENNEMVIRLPLIMPLRPSSSGKTLLVASSNGSVKTDCQVDGKQVTIGVNAYVPK